MENIIELKNITKAFGDNIVLKDVDIKVSKGSMTAITGESGCGKTTLLNIIGLLEDFDKGTLKIANQKFKSNSLKNKVPLLRNTISYLFQNFALIDNQSVSYNLDIALKYVKKSKQEKHEMKVKALEDVGLKGFLNRKVYQLSGGEQQRVAIARAMLKPSEIILADEPTGSLDIKNKSNVMEFLKLLNNSGKTIVIVTHDSDVAAMCNNILVLDTRS